jgi:WD40 repeat protein
VVVASDEASGRTLLWDRRTRDPERHQEIEPPTSDGAFQFAVSLDGAWLGALTTGESESRFWLRPVDDGAVSWRELALTDMERSRRLTSFAFHPRGNWLAGLTDAGDAMLWSLPEVELVEPNWPAGFHPETDLATAFAFSGDGKWLCLGSSDGDVVIVDLSGGRLEGTRLAPGVVASIESLAFDASSERLAAGARSMTSVWRIGEAGWRQSRPITIRSERRRGLRVQRLAFSNDARRLAVLLRDDSSPSRDHVTVHRLAVDDLMKLAVANAGRSLTTEERKKFLPEEFEKYVPLRNETDDFHIQARSLHRAVVLGLPATLDTDSCDAKS